MKDDVVSRTPPQAQPPQTAPLPDLPPAGALTASRLSLAEKCPPAFALPHAATESGPSTRGTLVHAYIEHVLSTGEADPSRIKDPEARKLCEQLDPVELYRVARGKPTFGTTGRPEEPVAEADGSVEEELFTELPLALDPESGQARTLPSTSGGHRDYSEAPHGWVCGTADAVAVFGGGRYAPYYGQDELSGPPAPPGKVVVTDWKTGAIAVEHPEANLQLRFLALAAARAFGEAGAAVEQAVVQLAYIDGSGGISVSAFEFDADDLAGIHEQIRAIARRVDEARTKPVAAPAARLAEQQQDATGLPGASRLKGLKVSSGTIDPSLS